MRLALAVEAEDPYTSDHCERVAHFAAAIAEGLGFAEEHVWRVRTVGVLHDVGKLGTISAYARASPGDALLDRGSAFVVRAGL